MPKKFLKNFMPDHDTVRNHRYLQLFGNLLHDPNLWHLNRRSAAGAFAVGLFIAFIPIPMQMVLAAAVAILARVNLALSLALVWLTNPITMPPIFYGAYKLGAWLLDSPEMKIHFNFSEGWYLSELIGIWQPLLLGSLIFATVSSLTGFLLIRGLWRLRIVRHHQRKKNQRLRREANVDA